MKTGSENCSRKSENAESHQKLKRREGVSPRSFKGSVALLTRFWTSGFQPWENEFLPPQVIMFAVICFGRPENEDHALRDLLALLLSWSDLGQPLPVALTLW